MIGLVLSLLLSTLITWFSLDHKRYAFDYDCDSDSVVSENQPLVLFLEANLSFDSAEFLSRRLHDFERTLNVVSSSSRVSFPTEVQLLSDLDALVHIVSQQRQCFEDLSYLVLHD